MFHALQPRRPLRARPTPPPLTVRPAPPRPPQRSLVTSRPRSSIVILIKFIQGYATGFLGGGLLAFILWVLFLLLFPLPRTNILILGLDRRPSEATFVSRTDTMMLMTVNARDGYVGALSIPRDLWVTLPDGSTNRVNTAHFFAEANASGTGPTAAMQTVQNNFGVDVHHYVRLDLVGFVKIIDAVGGIDLDVPHPLLDYEYPTDDYGITTMQFDAGPQHMNGERALAYARIRHGSSDFQRAERQGLVIAALLDKLARPATWVRLPALLTAIGSSVNTDLSPLEMMRLAPTLLRVGPSGLDRRVIEGAMVQPFTTEGGANVQLPVWEAINPVLLEMFGQ